MNPWEITQNKYKGSEVAFYETVFSLTNGLVGVRATLDYNSRDCRPGIFISGLYDYAISVANQLVNIPNWLDISIIIENENINLDIVEILDFSRILDMKTSILKTNIRFKDKSNRITLLQREEFLNKDNIHLVRYMITPINYNGNIAIESCTDFSVTNNYHGGYLGQDVRSYHFDVIDFKILDGMVDVCFKTKKTQKYIEIKSVTKCSNSNYFQLTERNRLGVKLVVNAEKNEMISFHKITTLDTSDDISILKNKIDERFNNATFPSYENLLNSHKDDWHKKWDSLLISIETENVELKQGLLFSLYQLLALNDSSLPIGTNIPPRGLSSEYHHGHFFFNTELYMVPFYAWIEPEFAKSLLYYRLNTLEVACKNARSLGLKGAFWSEESDYLGYPAGPTTVCDFISGEKFNEYTGRLVKHIPADVCYAIHQYVSITGDFNFEKEATYLIFECARYYTSISQYDNITKQYEIHDVVGPDEYHVGVNNNFYTNYIVQWTMKYAIEVSKKYKISLDEGEVDHWADIAFNIKLYSKNNDNVIEQFDGYFDLRDWTISARRKNGLPLIDTELIEKIFKFSNVGLKIVKQSDVVMLLSMFLQGFSQDEKKENLDFYEKRTIHESSLSLTHAGIVAGNIGDMDLSWKYIFMSSRFNLDFDPKTNYNNGLHLAAYAGAWLIFIYGILGISIHNNNLVISPLKCESKFYITFLLKFHGNKLLIESSYNKVVVTAKEIINNNFTFTNDNKIISVKQGDSIEIKLV
ncbi:MAG: hypothetical protein WBL93_08250 [Lutisporaceae bacterium]